MSDEGSGRGIDELAGRAVAALISGSFAEAFRKYSSAFDGGGKSRVSVPSVAADAAPEEKRKALREALVALAGADGDSALGDRDIDGFAKFFENLYGTGEKSQFRHMYSEICEVMYGFLNDGGELDEEPPPKALLLANNIVIIEKALEGSPDGDQARKSVGKLSDHVNLELTRMKYMAKQNRTASEAVRKLEETSSDYRKAIDEFEPKMRNELRGLQRDNIAILGLFSAIVLAFNAGIALTTSAIGPVATSEALVIAFITSTVGLVLFDTMFALMTFVHKIVRDRAGRWSIMSRTTFVFANVVIAAVTIAFAVASYIVR